MDSTSRATYEALPDALDANSPVSVTAFPDGSVDRRCRVRVGADTAIDDRATFGGRIEAGASKAFRLDPREAEPGGQAVNMAVQAHALSDDVTLYGHLDHPTLSAFPFATVSMGDPARVSVCEFEEGDVVLSEESRDLADWTFEDLRAVADLDGAFGADVVCCGNWVSIPGMDDALRAAADHLVADVFVLDPGDVTGSSDGALLDLLDALAALASGWTRVVLCANRAETNALAAAVGARDADLAEGLAAVRERADLAGVVCHDVAAATAASPDEVVHVANLDTEGTVRETGGGDRFTAGFAHGLAVGWDLRSALALGNACASYYVERGETITRDEIRPYLGEYL
ncbi:PfkB family carbohydrate kinase [Halomarina halobia]|uniref:PfkB family carbohydrate kinase n=1 Tax=Halomarina halobia TaxID=3033386 RepID=A0ABD6A8C7_9EURY|nr:PfkB family carbohydrate kinase [Halomarina sp. PSR21]